MSEREAEDMGSGHLPDEVPPEGVSPSEDPLEGADPAGAASDGAAPDVLLHPLLEELRGISGLSARADEPLRRHTALRVGGPADLYAVAHTLDALRGALSVARRHRLPWRALWPQQPVLIREGGLPGLTLRLAGAHEQLLPLDGGQVRLGAAAPFAALAALGPAWAPVAGWAGTPGGLFAAGHAGWLAGVLVQVQILKGRSVIDLEVPPGGPPPELGPKELLLSVTLAPGKPSPSRKWRRRPPTAAEALADPPQAACPAGVPVEFERAGLPGTRLRAWRLSPHRPGEVEHLGGGTADDLLLLLQGVADRLSRARGLQVEPAWTPIGRPPPPTRQP